jgi:hypothetical protein
MSKNRLGNSAVSKLIGHINPELEELDLGRFAMMQEITKSATMKASKNYRSYQGCKF